jgi:Ca-activated chloride channel family protein
MRFLVSLILSFSAFVLPAVAFAKTPLPPSIMDRGGLYFPGDKPGTVVAAPLVKTDITVDISGPIARYRLRHTFVNNSETWTEAIYTYPLPADSAVDRLYMQVGARQIIGKIEEKEEAKRQYNAAKSAGKRTSLVEQHRPNLFSTSVANLGPGEHVIVEIGFQDYLKMDNGHFSMRMPLVVGPRYISHQEIQSFQLTGWEAKQGSATDIDKISPPLRTAEEGLGNPVDLKIRLDAGFPIASIKSVSHQITTENTSTGVFEITLANTAPADRDFILNWIPKKGSAPTAGLFTEIVDNTRYALLMLTPLMAASEFTGLDRDVTFIIDTSGSMDGASIDQARAALRLALDRLRPNDRFQIVRFSNEFSMFRAGLVSANRENLSAAKSYVSGLTADGGTEIVNAVAAALSEGADKDRLSQVILITDGAVSNEDALFRLIEQNVGDRRFFTVGIGSAPNGYLMTRAARAGRGSYTYIQSPDQVASQMSALFGKLESPALVDARASWNGTAEQVEMWPSKLPDLYFGEPLTVMAKLPPGVTSVDVTGRIGDRIWSTTVQLKGGQSHPGVGTLWGREKIKGLMHALRLAEDPTQVKAEIIQTALTFDLVSRYTSLVAIDDQIARPKDQQLSSVQVPTNLPDGWVREGSSPQLHPAPASGLQKTRAFDRSSPMIRHAMLSSATQLANIPQTATNAPLMLIVGGFMTLLAALAMCIGWVRRARCA